MKVDSILKHSTALVWSFCAYLAVLILWGKPPRRRRRNPSLGDERIICMCEVCVARREDAARDAEIEEERALERLARERGERDRPPGGGAWRSRSPRPVPDTAIRDAIAGSAFAARDRPWAWTGIGCDCCGFGTVENCDEFDPRKPCPECAQIMLRDEKTCGGCDEPKEGCICHPSSEHAQPAPEPAPEAAPEPETKPPRRGRKKT